MSDIRFNQWLHQSGTGGVSQVASGAVGVGTTNPLADFYVRGDAQITGILTAGHIAMGSSITFGDNDRIYLGDGTDFQLYHASSDNNSYIVESGAGSLVVNASKFHVKNAANNEDIAVFNQSGNNELYFSNSKKFETTNTGAVVTGILTATNRIHATSLRIANTNFSAAGNADELILGDTSGNRGLTIVSGNTGIGALFFADDGSTNVGSLVYEHNTNQMRMNVAGAQIMRLDYTSSIPTWIIGNDLNTHISRPSADTFAFTTGGTERLRIDDVDGVVAKHTTAANLRVQNSTAATGQVAQLDLAPANSLSGVQLKATSEEDFSTGANRTAFFSVHNRKDGTYYERLRIDSSGRLAFGGVSNNDDYDTNARNILLANESGNFGITIRSGGSDPYAMIHFADGTSNADEFRAGRIFYHHNANAMVFSTANTERFRIDSSGDMTFTNSTTSTTAALSAIKFANGVGEVARIRGENRNGNTNGMITFHSDISGTLAERMRINHDGAFCFGSNSARPAEFTRPNGFSIRWDDKGQFQSTVTDTTGGLMNREGSDGGILSFRRGGTGVGEIGVNSSTIYLNFGGTNAAAHQLDDYEEGSWTPSVTIETRPASDSPIDSVQGNYVKVGSLVHAFGQFTLNGTPSERSTSRAIELRGFPFTHTHGYDKVGGDIRSSGHLINSTYGQDIYFVMRMISGAAYCRIEVVEQSHSGTRNASPVMTDNMNVIFSFTYAA